jgi:hypothetical protein
VKLHRSHLQYLLADLASENSYWYFYMTSSTIVSKRNTGPRINSPLILKFDREEGTSPPHLDTKDRPGSLLLSNETHA